MAPDDLLVVRDPDHFLAMESALVRQAEHLFGGVMVDTSTLTPAEVDDAITSLLPVG